MSPFGSYLDTNNRPGPNWQRRGENEKRKQERTRRNFLLGGAGAITAAFATVLGGKKLYEWRERKAEREERIGSAKKYVESFPDEISGCIVQKFPMKDAARVIVAISQPTNPVEKKKTEDTLLALLQHLAAGHEPLNLYVEGVNPQTVEQIREAKILRKERLDAAKNLEKSSIGTDGKKLEDMRSRVRALRSSEQTGWKKVEDRFGGIAELMERGLLSLEAAEDPQARMKLMTPEERVKKARGVSPEVWAKALLKEQEDMFLRNTSYRSIAFLLHNDRHDLRDNVRSYNEAYPEKATSLISVEIPQ